MKKRIILTAAVALFGWGVSALAQQPDASPSTAIPLQADSSAAPPLSLSIGALRTEAENAGIRLAVDFVENTFGKAQTHLFANANSRNVFLVTPEAHILTGDKDAFQGIVAKVTGLETFFPRHDVDIAGLPWPDLEPTIQTVPFSAGFESDGKFKSVSAIAEVGYVPWLPNPLRFRLRPGTFLQGGYKFGRASTSPNSDGSTDQSQEKADSGLFRVKQSLVLDGPEWPFLTTSYKFKVLGSGDFWYDIVNSTTYHRVTGTLRFIISKDRYFDATYEHGSGAPNFNRGDQFSTSMTITF
jgi:hypothetical protein